MMDRAASESRTKLAAVDDAVMKREYMRGWFVDEQVWTMSLSASRKSWPVQSRVVAMPCRPISSSLQEATQTEPQRRMGELSMVLVVHEVAVVAALRPEDEAPQSLGPLPEKPRLAEKERTAAV
jgi:hypothetical protein